MSSLATYILDDAAAHISSIPFEEINGKTILITGASGLIGHYMTAMISAAAKNGNTPSKVCLIVKSELPSYYEDLLKELPHEILRGDITDSSFLKSLPNADYIIHAAGYGQPGKFMADEGKTIMLNTVSTYETLKKLNAGGKYLFMSSSEVYSGLDHPPFKESQIGTTNTDHPRSCYIEGKRCGEAIVNAARKGGIDAKSARLSLAYGPGTRTDDARVLNNFIKKAITTGKIDMMDQGKAMRTYLYVTDAAQIMFNILFSGKDAIYNVGGESRTTIGGLAESIGSKLGVPVTFPEATAEGVSGAPDDVYLDMSKVKEEFGFDTFISLDEGLGRTIEWQKMLYLL